MTLDPPTQTPDVSSTRTPREAQEAPETRELAERSQPPPDDDERARGDRPSADVVGKATTISTLGGLVAYAYGQTGKRLSIPAKVFKQLATYPDPAAVELVSAQARVTELAVGDPLIAVPPRLLVATAEIADGRLRRQVLGLAELALRQHPAFEDDAVRLALAQEPEDRDHVLRRLRTTVGHISPDRLGVPSTTIKKPDRNELMANAVTALALLLAVRDRWTTTELVECLETHLWQHASSKRGPRRPLALITDSRARDALAVVARAYTDRVRHAADRLKEVEAVVEQTMRQVDEARAALDERERDLDARARTIEDQQRRIGELEVALEDERHGRVVDRSHHITDYDTLRTRVIRLLGDENKLLVDALHALENGRASVTQEYVERAVHAFTKELDQLQEKGDGR